MGKRAGKKHIVRGDRTACGYSGPILRRLDFVSIPSAIPFVCMKMERRFEILMAATCRHCIRRRNEL